MFFCLGKRGVIGPEHAGILPTHLSSVLRQAAAPREAGARGRPQDLRPDQQRHNPRGLCLTETHK